MPLERSSLMVGAACGVSALLALTMPDFLAPFFLLPDPSSGSIFRWLVAATEVAAAFYVLSNSEQSSGFRFAWVMALFWLLLFAPNMLAAWISSNYEGHRNWEAVRLVVFQFVQGFVVVTAFGAARYRKRKAEQGN